MISHRVPIPRQRLDVHFTYLISQVLHRIVVVISNRVYSISLQFCSCQCNVIYDVFDPHM